MRMTYNELGMPRGCTDISGNRYGKLLVIKFAYVKRMKSYFTCKCDCGNIKEISANDLKRGLTLSCSCDKGREKRTIHGKTNTRIYRIWRNMLNRCEYIKNDNYRFYGELGIKVCERWHTFNNFYEDVKQGYADNLSLDRIDSKGNYEPNNFRWATQKEQTHNMKSNVYYELNGERLSVQEWSIRIGCKTNAIAQRLSYGWSLEKALTTSNRYELLKQNKCQYQTKHKLNQ